MSIKKIVVTASLFTALFTVGGVISADCYAANGYPDYVDENPAMEDNINKIAADAKIQKLITDLKSTEAADDKFRTFLYLTHIAAPSREEQYRAEATKELFQKYIDKYKATSVAAQNARVINNPNGVMEGAGLQIVDGLPVYNACMEIKGTYEGEGYNGQRPKVLLEGHLDSVNPAHLDGYPNVVKTLMPVYLQSINDPLVNTPEELAALPQLKFLENGWADESDPNYAVIKTRYIDKAAAEAADALRMYIPSIGDMMLQTTNVIQTAEFLLKHDIRPHYDLWICGTAGEEGRGNLDGMKQLFGYSQDGTKADGTVDETLKGKANNALNFVANMSTEGGVTIHYLGSHRYQIAYTGPGGSVADAKTIPNPAEAAATAISCIAKLKAPQEDPSLLEKYPDITGGDATIKTTYTVGLVYADSSKDYAAGKIPTDVSIEVDMRSNNTDNILIMDRQMQECFQYGVDTVNARYTGGVQLAKEQRWYGDRPAYVLTAEQMSTSPMLTAISYAHQKVNGQQLKLTDPSSASSVNSNVPAAIGIPTVNISYGKTAANGQGHSFNEWAVLGDAVEDAKVMERALYALFALTGYDEAGVQPAYGSVGPRTTEVLFK